MQNVFGRGKLTEYEGTGAPTGTNFVAGDTYTNLANGDKYVFNGSAWVLAGTISTNSVATAAIQNAAVTTAKIADGAVTTAKIANGAVTPAKLGTEVSGGVSLGTTYVMTIPVAQADLDGTVNVVATVPVGTYVYDVIALIDGGSGDTDTINIGTGNGGWVVGNNDPDGFIAAQSIENPVAYRSNKLSGALTSSGALAGSGTGNIVLETSADVSAVPGLGVVLNIILVKVDPSILGGP
jgi:hypothetical protein